ncbi:MAG: TIGR04219 family outer membrane beta-barrel protein, partial [Gammaproteobacteria bacterium]
MLKYLAISGLAVALMFVCAPKALADSWIEVGTTAWNTQLYGTVYSTTGTVNSSINLQDDLGMERHWNPEFYFVLYTPGFFIPNVRVEYEKITGNGTNSGNGTIVYNGVVYKANGNLLSQAALKQARVLFFWSPLDNSVVNLRLGLDLRWVSANLALTGTAVTISPPSTYRATTSAGAVSWLPLANLGLTVHLPANFDVDIVASYIAYKSSYLYDFRAGIAYHFGFGLSLKAGYRRYRLKVDDSNFSLNGDLDFKGPYAGLSWRF